MTDTSAVSTVVGITDGTDSLSLMGFADDGGMSRELLKLGGGSAEILRDVRH